MSMPALDPERDALRRRLQGHGVPWLLCRYVWVGIKLGFAVLHAGTILLRQRRFSAGRMRALDADRLDRIRNPARYRRRADIPDHFAE